MLSANIFMIMPCENSLSGIVIIIPINSVFKDSLYSVSEFTAYSGFISNVYWFNWLFKNLYCSLLISLSLKVRKISVATGFVLLTSLFKNLIIESPFSVQISKLFNYSISCLKKLIFKIRSILLRQNNIALVEQCIFDYTKKIGIIGDNVVETEQNCF